MISYAELAWMLLNMIECVLVRTQGVCVAKSEIFLEIFIQLLCCENFWYLISVSHGYTGTGILAISKFAYVQNQLTNVIAMA
jgi:hypothetical protein